MKILSLSRLASSTLFNGTICWFFLLFTFFLHQVILLFAVVLTRARRIWLRGRLFSLCTFLLILMILLFISSLIFLVISSLLAFPIISSATKGRLLFLFFLSLAFHNSSRLFAFHINFAVKIENL